MAGLQKTITAVVSKQIEATLPWWESTALWACISIGIGIVFGVVATMVTDLRWMLLLAGAFFWLAAFIGTRKIRSRVSRWAGRVLLCALTVVVLWRINSILPKKIVLGDVVPRTEQRTRQEPYKSAPLVAPPSKQLKIAKPPHVIALPQEPKTTDLLQSSRHLFQWQKTKIIAELAEYPGQHILILVHPDDETRRYAADFREIFTKASWKVEVKDAPEDQAVLNIVLLESEVYWTKPVPIQYQKLRQVLGAVQIKMRKGFTILPDVLPDHIVLWIGPPSPQGYNHENEFSPVTQMPCLNPVQFSDKVIESPRLSLGEYAHEVMITSPPGTRVNNNMRAYITGQATGYGTFDNVPIKVTAAGKVMPRNDALNLIPDRTYKPGEQIPIVILCAQEFRVKCIDDLGLK